MTALIVSGITYAQDDALFQRYSIKPKDKAHILDLNREFESKGIKSYPLPLVVSGIYEERKDTLTDVNFGNAPLRQVINFYSQLTGVNVILDPGISMEISYIGYKRFAYDELLRVLLRIFNDNGLVLTKIGDRTVRMQKNNIIEQGDGD